MVEDTSFGPALLHRGLASLKSLRGRWIPKFIKKFFRIMWECLYISWNSEEVVWCNRIMTLNTGASQQQNGFRKTKSTFYSRSPDLNPTEMPWNNLKRAIHERRPKNMTGLKQFCQEEWAKIPTERCAGLIHSYRKSLLEVIADRGVNQSLIQRVHLFFSSSTMIFLWLFSIKTWKIRIFCVIIIHMLYLLILLKIRSHFMTN